MRNWAGVVLLGPASEKKPSGDLLPRVRDCLERDNFTNQTAQNRPSITSLLLIPVSINIFETSASLDHLSESIRARDVNVPSCRRLGTTSFDSRSDQNRSSGLFEHVNAASSRRSCLPYGRSSEGEPEPYPWSYADQRDRQSPRTAGHNTIPQASVGSPIRGKLMDFS
jgi:hypothetical protein